MDALEQFSGTSWKWNSLLNINTDSINISIISYKDFMYLIRMIIVRK